MILDTDNNLRYISTNPKGDKMIKCLVLMVGLPASGKSTYLKNIAPVLDKQGYKHCSVSSDAFIEEYAASQGLTYDQVFTEYVNTAAEKFATSLVNAFDFNDIIFVDRTNLTPSTRAKIINMIPEQYVDVTEVHAVVFHIDEELQNRRLAERIGKFIPPDVIAGMKKTFVEPSEEAENFKSITVVNA